jgi:hypothetical protein
MTSQASAPTTTRTITALTRRDIAEYLRLGPIPLERSFGGAGVRRACVGHLLVIIQNGNDKLSD